MKSLEQEKKSHGEKEQKEGCLGGLEEGGSNISNRKENSEVARIDFGIRFFGRERLGRIVLGSFLSILSGISTPLFLLYFGLALQKIPQNSSSTQQQYDEFMYYIYCLVGVTLNSFVSGWLSIGIFESLSEGFVKDLKRKSFQYLLQADEAWHSENDEGSVSFKMIANFALVREGYGIKFSQLISNVSQFIFGFVVGFYRGWKMSLVMSASLPLVAAAGFFITKIHKSWDNSTKDAYSKSGALAFEAFRNIKLVKSYCLEEFMFKKYYEAITQVEKIGQRASLMISLGMGIVSFIIFASYSLGFWYGGVLVADSMDSGCLSMDDLDCFTVANVFSIFFMITNASIALGQSSPSLGSLVKGFFALKELSELFGALSVNTQKIVINSEKIEGRFEFREVSFTYPGRSRMVLKDFNLVIQPGKVTALIGGSGCGKSSISKLLLRLYEPDQGNIFLDGVELSKYDLNYLRRKITIVDQESKLFNDTIRQNVLYGNMKATEEEVIEALKLSQAWEFVKAFPEGLDTNVGNEGCLLSGGQRQRIAIARAIVRNSSVIILDEATSGLDVRTEALFTEAFRRLVSKRKQTVILIAHRLQTICFSDEIVVMDTLEGEGGIQILEQGSRVQLMANKEGIFSNLLARTKEEQFLGSPIQDSHQNKFPISDMDKERTLSKLTTFYSKNSTRGSMRQSLKFSTEDLGKGLSLTQRETRDYSLMMDLINENIKAFSIRFPKVSSFKLLLLLKSDLHFLILGILFASVQGATFPLMGFLIGRFVTSGTLPTSDLVRAETGNYSLYFFLLALLIFLTTSAQNSFLQISGERLVKRLRAESFYSLLYQDVSFHEHSVQSPIKLCEVLAEDTRLTKSLVGENIGLYTQNIVTVILGFVISFSSSVELTLVILGFFLLLIPTGYAQSKIIKGTTNRDLDRKPLNSIRKQSVSYIQEVLRMHSIIKIFNLEQDFKIKYRRSTRYEYFKGVADSHLLGACWGFGQGIQNAAQTFGLWYGSRMTFHQKIGVGDLVQTILVLILTAASVCRSQIYATDKKKAKVSANKVFSYIDRVPSTKNRCHISMEERCLRDFSKARNERSQKSILEGKMNTRIQRLRKFFKAGDFVSISPKRLESLLEREDFRPPEQELRSIGGGEIIFNNVNFSYGEEEERLILSRVSFVIRPGEFVAIIGQSGSGKSTIFELLERFYILGDLLKEGQEEERNSKSFQLGSSILIDGVDINDLDVGELRSYFSFVQQNPVLFAGTIRENILLGRMEASEEEVLEAARMSQIYDFIVQLPEGFDSKVGEGGFELSVGQKQRINLARAFLKGSGVLILDEPTASLDLENEELIMDSIQRYSRERKSTIILITHRLGTIRGCDRILVLGEDFEKGGSTIVEEGTHLEKKRRRGKYRKTSLAVQLQLFDGGSRIDKNSVLGCKEGVTLGGGVKAETGGHYGELNKTEGLSYRRKSHQNLSIPEDLQ
ncbi:ABC transporter transmembrane region domain-containing protein [Cryptosporidium felis]|nr:ABC transporter transmembrane region domain-containing protein [Cryptosporidium felis]